MEQYFIFFNFNFNFKPKKIKILKAIIYIFILIFLCLVGTVQCAPSPLAGLLFANVHFFFGVCNPDQATNFYVSPLMLLLYLSIYLLCSMSIYVCVCLYHSVFYMWKKGWHIYTLLNVFWVLKAINSLLLCVWKSVSLNARLNGCFCWKWKLNFNNQRQYWALNLQAFNLIVKSKKYFDL